MLSSRLVAGATTAAAGAAAVLALTVPAGAASCRAMVVSYSLGSSNLVVLSPSHVDIGYGGCVQFTNQTAANATVTVSGGYSQQLAPDESTSGARNYVGRTPGRQQVTATSGSTPANTARGSISVGASPSAAPSPVRSAGAAPHHNASPAASVTPAPAPTPTASGPRVAPTPHKSRSPRSAIGVISPPVSPAGPIRLPSPASAAVASGSGPVEPATGRGVGLPAALAALAIVGAGAALVRVIAREAVDNGDLVGGAS